jgi:hypothetical protein
MIGYHGNKYISVWNNTNREIVEPSGFMDFVAAARSVFYQPFKVRFQH